MTTIERDIVDMSDETLLLRLRSRDSSNISYEAIVRALMVKRPPDVRLKVLSSIIEEGASSGSRRAAARQMVTLGPPAEELVTRLIHDEDEVVAAAAMSGLGRWGTAKAYHRLMEPALRRDKTLSRRAEHAARLVAHRHGLPADELPERGYDRVSTDGARVEAVEIEPASPAEVSKCLTSLADRLLGIAVDSKEVRLWRCSSARWMFLPDRRGPKLIGQRSIPFAWARFVESSNRYSMALLALLTPRNGGGSIVVVDATGNAAFTGSATPKGDEIEVTVEAVHRPGAFPFTLVAGWRPGSHSFKTVQAGVRPTVPKREPTPLRFGRRGVE